MTLYHCSRDLCSGSIPIVEVPKFKTESYKGTIRSYCIEAQVTLHSCILTHVHSVSPRFEMPAPQSFGGKCLYTFLIAAQRFRSAIPHPNYRCMLRNPAKNNVKFVFWSWKKNASKGLSDYDYRVYGYKSRKSTRKHSGRLWVFRDEKPV